MVSSAQLDADCMKAPNSASKGAAKRVIMTPTGSMNWVPSSRDRIPIRLDKRSSPAPAIWLRMLVGEGKGRDDPEG